VTNGSEQLFNEIPGQRHAKQELRRALLHPVHAYLFLGPQGCGATLAAKDFAGALLCTDGGCGSCADCRKVESGVHPDLIVAERAGASYSIDDVRTLNMAAQRRPLEAARTVIVIPDAQLLAGAAPALLKTLEEPPSTTHFILVANDLPREMTTIRSRCAEINFENLSTPMVEQWLVERGVGSEDARSLAEGAAGDAERALLLASDPGFLQRLDLWKRIPDLLDGSGAAAIEAALQIDASLKQAVEPLVVAHKAELTALEDQAKSLGERGLPGRKEILDRFKREERKYQQAELLAGLATLSRRYRDRLRAAQRQQQDSSTLQIKNDCAAIDSISLLAKNLRRNPRQPLNLEQLFLELSR
jgi:DNA polymerase III subunit delta'